MTPELTLEEYSAALDEAAAAALGQAGVDGPPVDALRVARRLEIIVARDDSQSGRARRVCVGASAGDMPHSTILIRDDPRAERRQWSVAHEIGEQLAGEVFARLGVDPRAAPSGTREHVANSLAGRLLLPTAWFGPAAVACEWDLLELKRRFPTASHELIARRMLDFAPPIIVSIFDQGRLSFRRGNRPGRTPPLAPLERECWRGVHSSGESICLSDEAGLAAFGWPIHESEWMREILRTVLGDGGEAP